MITSGLQGRWNCLAAVCVAVLLAPVHEAAERLEPAVARSNWYRSREFRLSADVLAAEISQRFEVSAVPLSNQRSPITLEIERFNVFSSDARIVVHTPDGDEILPIPRNLYFKGTVVGEPGSTVIMTALDGGPVRGLITMSGRYWVFSGHSVSPSLSTTLEIREVEQVIELEHDAQSFECGTDGLETPPRLGLEGGADLASVKALKSAGYTARIAVETDKEFFDKFGNETDAANYVADLIAFGSAMYSSEVNTSWVLQHLSLWTTTDPWGQTSPDCGLYEFGRYWNDNNQGISRTTAAFFSGKSIGGGIAWLGVLCYSPFNVNLGQSCPSLTPSLDNYGGGYAYIGGMDGNFDIDNPSVVWDVVAVTHEIGHNFDSPHTHCYAGLGGNSSPIDECYSGQCGSAGCHCGGTSLPSGCPGSGNGCGTIMSYCHLLSGGFSNMSLTLGQGHPYGVEPDRVPSWMLTHVISRAAANPGCLDSLPMSDIFSDGFESGDTGEWTASTP